MTNKYEVLGATRTSSLSELKKAYQTAALTYHPDKQVGNTDKVRFEVCGGPSPRSLAFSSDARLGYEIENARVTEKKFQELSPLELHDQQAAKKFQAVQEAWETLRDTNLREEYDYRLKNQAKHVVVSEEVDVTLMTREDDQEGSVVYLYQCRCGEDYEVTAAELFEGLDIVGCHGCSLHIRVIGEPQRSRAGKADL